MQIAEHRDQLILGERDGAKAVAAAEQPQGLPAAE
jgi:hypothetical protein